MPDDIAVALPPRSRQAWIPWLVRALVSVGLLVIILIENIGTYGLERDGSWSLGEPMTIKILAAGVVFAAPFAGLEGFFARRARRLWLQCLLAAAGAAVITWVGTLPIGLRFFASRDPVRQSDVEMALSSILLMGLAYALLVRLCRSAIRRPRRV